MTRRELLQTSVVAAAGSSLYADAPKPFKLGIITDEITQNLDEALAFIEHYHLQYCELREVWSKNVMNLSQEELDRAKKLISARGMHVSDIASPMFKWNLPEMPAKANETRDEFSAKFTEDDARQGDEGIVQAGAVFRNQQSAHLQLLARCRS